MIENSTVEATWNIAKLTIKIPNPTITVRKWRKVWVSLNDLFYKKNHGWKNIVINSKENHLFNKKWVNDKPKLCKYICPIQITKNRRYNTKNTFSHFYMIEAHLYYCFVFFIILLSLTGKKSKSLKILSTFSWFLMTILTVICICKWDSWNNE